MSERESMSDFERDVYYEDPAEASYVRHDDRYTGANQLRDWVIIFAIGAFHFVWMLIVFLFEPGIR